MTTSTKTQGDIQALSSDYVAAWEAGDPERIVSLHTVDTRFALHAGGDAPPVVGRDAGCVAFREVFAQWPGFSFETHRLLLGEDHWVLDWTLVASRDGEPVRVPLLDVVTVAPDGLVSSKDTYLSAGASA